MPLFSYWLLVHSFSLLLHWCVFPSTLPLFFLFLSFDNFPGCLLPLIKYLLPLVLQVSVRTPYHFPSPLPLLASHIKISLSYIPIHSCSLALFSLIAFFFLFLFISLFPIFILLSLTLSLLQCNSRVNYLHASVFMYHTLPSYIASLPLTNTQKLMDCFRGTIITCLSKVVL